MVRARPFNSIEGRACPCAPAVKSNRKKVLFICTHNSARSQMAEGLLNCFYGDKYQAFSAGVKPDRLHPNAIDAMAEIGVDISCQRSKSIEEVMDNFFDTVVTVCDNAREQCPIYPDGAEVLHHSFDDPSSFDGSNEERAQRFRQMRDEIREWIEGTFGPSSSRYLSRPSDFS